MPRLDPSFYEDTVKLFRQLRIAYLEHQLLPGPYMHTDLCEVCYPKEN